MYRDNLYWYEVQLKLFKGFTIKQFKCKHSLHRYLARELGPGRYYLNDGKIYYQREPRAEVIIAGWYEKIPYYTEQQRGQAK